ncbi:MAG: isoprenylcysteine carboxylmethyltransferase family protein [Anaerolineales bacterium]|nr:isoprenylcysteine carboxylmethyltransferase family protein [Anaerolineales bacterium]
MGSAQVLKIIFFAQFIALLAIRVFFGWMVRRAGQSSWSVEKEAVKREGAWSILLRPLGFLALLALVGLYAFIPGEPDWLILPLPVWLRGLGVVLGAFGLLYLIWVHYTLREYWSTVLQLRKAHALITAGPYRWIRHPMYSALMVCFFSLALISAAWPLLLLAALTLPFFYRVTVKEERMMIGQFGEEYRAYRERTGRFLPRAMGPDRS